MNLPPTEQVDPDWEGHLERCINHRTSHRVRWLRVERTNGRVIVHGVARSYYVCQLALAAILEVLESWPLDQAPRVELDIEVSRA